MAAHWLLGVTGCPQQRGHRVDGEVESPIAGKPEVALHVVHGAESPVAADRAEHRPSDRRHSG